jgi:hypothetical protein
VLAAALGVGERAAEVAVPVCGPSKAKRAMLRLDAGPR